MSQCVFCETTTGLNTQISVTLDSGKKVVCDICETHAEDATPKSVKAAYLEKQGKAEALLAQLRAMGYNVDTLEQGKSGLLIPTAAQPKPTRAQAIPEALPPETTLEGDDVVDTDVIDRKSRGMVSTSRSANFGGGQVSVGGHSSLDTASIASSGLSKDRRDELLRAKKGKAKMKLVEGREGRPLFIEEKRVDGMGTTRIKVVKKEDDTRLQSRFKKMADDTIRYDRTPDFARSGYQNTQADCPICRGDCVIVQNNKEISCPKCNGAGFISVY